MRHERRLVASARALHRHNWNPEVHVACGAVIPKRLVTPECLLDGHPPLQRFHIWAVGPSKLGRRLVDCALQLQ